MYVSPSKIREQAREQVAAGENTQWACDYEEGQVEEKGTVSDNISFQEASPYKADGHSRNLETQLPEEEGGMGAKKDTEQVFEGVVYQRIAKKGWEPFLCQINHRMKHNPTLNFYSVGENGAWSSTCQEVQLKGAKVIGRGVITIKKRDFYAFQILYPAKEAVKDSKTPTKYQYVWVGLETREDYEIWLREMENAVKSAVSDILRDLSFRTRKPRRGEIMDGKSRFLGNPKGPLSLPVPVSSKARSRNKFSNPSKRKEGLSVSFADMFAEDSDESLTSMRRQSDKCKPTKIRRTPVLSSQSRSRSRKGARGEGWLRTPTTDPLQRGIIRTQMGRRVKGNASYIADRVSSRSGQRMKIFAPQPIPRPKTRAEDPSSLLGALPEEVIKAVIKGDDEKVISFVQFSGWGWDHMMGGQGERLMNLAAQHQRPSLVSALIKQGANVDGKDGSGESILCTAAKYGRWQICEILLVAGADPNLADFHDDSPLCHACASSHREAVHLLLCWKASPTQANFRGITPFITACSQGDPHIVQMLLASEEELKQMVPNPKDLLQAKARSLKKRQGHTGEVTLESKSQVGTEGSASSNDTKILVINNLVGNEYEEEQDAIVNGINLEHKTTSGLTALYAAAQRGHLEVVKILIEKGARIQESNMQGMAPLYAAAEQGHHYVVEALLQAGTDAKTADNKGDTALHAAVRSGDTRSVLHLLNFDADLYKMNSKGETPLSLIKKSKEMDKKQLSDFVLSQQQRPKQKQAP